MRSAMRAFLIVLFADLALASPPSGYGLQVSSGQPGRGNELSPLAPGLPIEGELRGGQTNSYSIRAQAGQFLHVTVEQHGIHVVLMLFTPQGRPIARTDMMNGATGTEPISAIAAESGEFRLDVASFKSGAPTGRYIVRLADPRQTTPADRARLGAEQAYMEGTYLFLKSDVESKRAAIPKWEQSLEMWRSINDAYDVAVAANSISYAYNFTGDKQKALGSLLQVPPLWHAANDPADESAALGNIAFLYSELGQNQRALDYDNQSLAIRRALGDRPGEAAILFAIGSLYSKVDEYQKAVDSYNQAGKIDLALGDRAGTAATLSNLGVAYSAMGEKQKALACYTQALSLKNAIGDRADESATLTGAAQIFFELGQNDKGIEMLNRVLELARSGGTNVDQARTLSNLATIYSQMGDKQKALNYFEQALPVEQAAGDRAGEAVTLGELGALYAELGEKDKGLDYVNQALQIDRATGDRINQARTLTLLGSLYNNSGDKQKALDYYDQALQVERAIGDRSGEATALRAIGELNFNLGKTQEALDYYNQALLLDRAVYDLRGESAVLTDQGAVYFHMGDMSKSLEAWNQALPLYQATGNVLGEADQMMDLMAYWYKQQKLEMAIFYGMQSIQRLQQVRQNIQGMSKEMQQSFLKSKAVYYRALANVLIKAQRFSEAQQVLDLVKQEEFASYTQTRGGGDEGLPSVAPTPAEKKNSDEYAKIAADVTAIGQQWSVLNAKSPRTPEEEQNFKELSAKLTAANQQMQAFFNNLYTSFGKGDQANQRVEEVNEETGSLQDLIRDPGSRTAVLYTLVLDDKLVIMVITPATRVAREVPITKADLQKKVRLFARALAFHEPDEEVQAKAQDLYNVLIAPVEKDLQGAQVDTLVWSLDDELRYIPMAALYDGKHYLVERYRNVEITSASIGSLKDKPQTSNLRALAMGVSKDYDGKGELKAVPGELDSIVHSNAVAGSHGPVAGTIMLNDAFTKESMEKALEQHPAVVHIASHYIFRGGADTMSYLLMGGDNVGGQGFHLTLADLRDDQRMDFDGIELLTLSACQTEVGSKDADGREIDGLGIVAQRKHARAVMASLWPVDDASVGLLMADFYRLWATNPGLTKSEALRQAQLALLHGTSSGAASGNRVLSIATAPSQASQAPYANPYYWAPFILIGNWK